MKKLQVAIGFMLLAALMAFTIGDGLNIGDKLPKAEVKMKDVNGKMVSIKDAMGAKGVLVMFSCNTCPYVIKNQERTVAINDYAKKMDIGVIVLNSNEAQRNSEDSYVAMQSYAKDQQYKWSYVIDENHQVADAFGANRTPEVFLFDKNQKLVYHGAIDDNPTDGSAVKRHHLKEAINELVAGKEVTVKETRSVGCTIKRNK